MTYGFGHLLSQDTFDHILQTYCEHCNYIGVLTNILDHFHPSIWGRRGGVCWWGERDLFMNTMSACARPTHHHSPPAASIHPSLVSVEACGSDRKKQDQQKMGDD